MDGNPSSRSAPRKRTRIAVAVAVPLAAVAAYAVMWRTVPGFAEHTLRGLSDLGLYTPEYDPGRRELIVRDGRSFLWGGPDDRHHFDVTGSTLDPERFHYGLGREHFPALIEPRFVSIDEVMTWGDESRVATLQALGSDGASTRPERSRSWLDDGARVLAVKVGDEVKVYPLRLLVRHEVVNDVVGGVPLFAAYCVLADLGAVYDRRLGEHALTFGLSGYTYSTPGTWDGRDAFVLWDRDTESLWWPPIGRAVSGPLVNTPLRVLDETLWSQTTWGEVRMRFPDARVLERDQPFDPPASWPRLPVTAPAATRPAGDDAPPAAPRWNENPDLG